MQIMNALVSAIAVVDFVMTRKNLTLFTSTLLAIATLTSLAHAQKGRKPKPTSDPIWNRGILELPAIGSGAVITGDELGSTYIDGEQGVFCMEGDGADVRAECHVPSRRVGINLGVRISEEGDAPFNGNLSGMSDATAFAVRGAWGGIWPKSGETLTNPESYESGGIHCRFIVAGTHYYLRVTGAGTSATGYDDDSDGVRDRVVVNIPDGTTADLRRLDVSPGNGKNKFVYSWTPAGDFAVPAASITFSLTDGTTTFTGLTMLDVSWPGF